jgi:hypothetical protein
MPNAHCGPRNQIYYFAVDEASRKPVDFCGRIGTVDIGRLSALRAQRASDTNFETNSRE